VKLCITRSEQNSYSETFIRDQIAGLSDLADVFTIHGGRLPDSQEDGTLLAPWPIWVMHKIVKAITGKRNNYFGNYGIKKYLSENNIDVVLANYGISAAHLAPICRELGIPLLAIFHGHDATEKKLVKAYAEKFNTLFAYASSIIVVSQDMRKKIIAMGADPSSVHVIPCGVDTDKFRPASVTKEKNFLAVGRFVNKKGPLFTIRAFHEVWKRHPDATLTMVGEHQHLYKECERLTNSLDMQGAVSFPGVLQHGEIHRLMNKAMAFVQHSVTAANGDMEGTPVSILEASACGLPIVSTLHGGIQEAVIHCKTGLLVNEGDVSGMTAAMLKLLDDAELRSSMGKEARDHMKENYDQVKQVEKIFDLAEIATGEKSSTLTLAEA
jgi:colanic acid/amylovoran biosynthesis glycosyltransferase